MLKSDDSDPSLPMPSLEEFFADKSPENPGIIPVFGIFYSIQRDLGDLDGIYNWVKSSNSWWVFIRTKWYQLISLVSWGYWSGTHATKTQRNKHHDFRLCHRGHGRICFCRKTDLGNGTWQVLEQWRNACTSERSRALSHEWVLQRLQRKCVQIFPSNTLDF